MAVAVSVTIYGTVTGLQSGQKIVGPYAVTAPAAPSDLTSGQTTSLVLANGNNTITIPSSNCTGAIVSFAPASVSIKILKGVNSDTGITVNGTGVFQLSFPGGGATPASFVINSSVVDTGNATEILFL